VIDNNCTDETERLCEELGRARPNLRRVTEPKQGLSHARNRAWKASSSEYICYLDDDALVPPHFIRTLFQDIEAHHPEILGGPVYPYYQDKKPFWFRDAYEIRKHARKTGFAPDGKVSGGNFTVQRQLLISLGGFDSSYGMVGGKVRMGEERMFIEAYKRARAYEERSIYYDLKAYILHYTDKSKMRLSYMMKRSYHSGYAIMSIKNKDPGSAPKRTMEFVPYLLGYCFRELRTNGPFKADYPMMACELAVRYGNLRWAWGFGFSYVMKKYLRYKYKPFRFRINTRGGVQKKWLDIFEEVTGFYKWLSR